MLGSLPSNSLFLRPPRHVDWGWSCFFDDYTNFNGGQSDLQRRSLFRLGKLRRVPTHQLTAKERATSTSFELIAAPDWKKILRAWCVALHGLIKNVYPIINLHTLSILPWRLRLLAKEISFFPYEIFFQDGIKRGDFLPINLIVRACHCFHDEMFDSGSIFT